MTHTQDEPLVELVVRAPAEHEDVLVASVFDVSPGGFRADVDGTTVEIGIYVPRADVAARTVVLTDIVRAVGIDAPVEQRDVESGWADGWKRFHKPVRIGKLWVGPPWDEPDAGAIPVVIEPGQGFGTGAHPTTHLVLDLMQTQPRTSVLDVGCGSGVLSVAASLLGFAPVHAIDNDPVAIDSTRENLERNGVSRVSVALADGGADRLPQTDLVLANMTLRPLQALAPRLKARRVIASGLLRSQVEEASAAFAQSGYVVHERRDREGWVALVLEHTEAAGHANGWTIV